MRELVSSNLDKNEGFVRVAHTMMRDSSILGMLFALQVIACLLKLS